MSWKSLPFDLDEHKFQMLYELRDLRKFKAENATETADLKQLLDAEQLKATLIEQQQREATLSKSA